MGDRLLPVVADRSVALTRSVLTLALALAMLLPGAASASIFCTMAGTQVATVCPCGHAEDEVHEPVAAETPVAIERAGCCSTKTSAIGTSVKSATTLDVSVAYHPTLVGQQFPRMESRPVVSKRNGAVRARHVRPPPTGPPLYIRFESLLN